MTKKFFKVFFVLIALVVLAVFLLWVAACSSPKVMATLLMSGANKFLDGATVHDLVIHEQNCRLTGPFTFEGVSFGFRQGTEEMDLRFEKILIADVFAGGSVQINSGKIISPEFSLKGLEMKIVSDGPGQWSGPVSLRSMKGNGIEGENLKAKIVLRKDRMTVEGIRADVHKGTIKGTVMVYGMPAPRYVAQITFDGIDTTDMETVNPALFSQVQGKLSGTAEAEGPVDGLDKIQLDIRLKDGGKIQAAVLAPLLSHLPASVERERLDKAIRNKNLISVTGTNVGVRHRDSETAAADIQLKSNDLNLDVNVTVDMIIEGGMSGLLKYFSQFSQFMKG